MKLSRSLMPELSALQAFEASARLGSFTRAALELNLTQSAISRQIRDLEALLGVALFDRVRQRVVLSATGQRLLPEAERILDGVSDLALRAASSRDVTGHLTVATLPTFGSRWLMPRLPDFLARHPGLQVTVLSRSGPSTSRRKGSISRSITASRPGRGRAAPISAPRRWRRSQRPNSSDRIATSPTTRRSCTSNRVPRSGRNGWPPTGGTRRAASRGTASTSSR